MKKILLLLWCICVCCALSAQDTGYTIIKTEVVSPEVVRVELKTLCVDKKEFVREANIAAIRTVLFNGIPNSQYQKPLLEDGEQTTYQKHRTYFDNLYLSGRYTDFIQSSNQLSKFKKGGKDKSTAFVIEVKILQLRKDLETNNVKRRIGY